MAKKFHFYIKSFIFENFKKLKKLLFIFKNIWPSQNLITLINISQLEVDEFFLRCLKLFIEEDLYFKKNLETSLKNYKYSLQSKDNQDKYAL
jgi:hypothetical protein